MLVRRLTRFVLPAVVAAAFALPAQAEFYSGKTITLLINSGAGGNTDALGRMFARHLERLIPGKPSVIGKNMVGAGGLVGTNFLGERAKADGETLGFFLINGGFAQLINAPELRVKYSDFEFIVGIGSPIVAFVRSDVGSGIKAPEGLADVKGFKAGGYNRNSTHDVRIRLTLDTFGADYQMITGYRSASKMFKAVLQNEIQFTSSSYGGYKRRVIPSLIKPGEGIAVWQYPVFTEDGGSKRHPFVPDVPTFVEVYKKAHGGKEPSGRTWEAFKLVHSTATITRAVLAPKGTPKDAVAELHAAVEKMEQDKQFQKDIEKRSAYMVSAKEGQQVLQKLGEAPEELTSFLAKYVKQ